MVSRPEMDSLVLVGSARSKRSHSTNIENLKLCRQSSNSLLFYYNLVLTIYNLINTKTLLSMQIHTLLYKVYII